MHRIRVPYVHPIVCCTFKRALRLLPSILLIAFVLSLIFVTLIQVAVIHSQRRAIYLQRRVNGVVSTASSSPLYAPQPSASAYLSSYGSPNINNNNGNSNNNNINSNNAAGGGQQPPTKGNQPTAVGGTVSAAGTGRQAGANGGANQKLPAGSPSSSGDSGGSGGPAGPTSKPGEPALRVEAILDRNAPSVENFAVSVNNNANAARIRRIFDAVKCHVSIVTSGGSGTSSSSNNNNSVNNGSSNCSSSSNNSSCATTTAVSVASGGGVDRSSGGSGVVSTAGSSASSNGNLQSAATMAATTTTTTKATSTTTTAVPQVAPLQPTQANDEACGGSNVTLCPEVPSGLRGRLKVDFSDRTADSSWEGAPALATVAAGGCWEPATCIARHRVAIVIPFRDRAEHLQLLLQHLHPILQRQMLSYKVFVIEQYGNDTFNKGVLLNAGAREALQDAKDYECLVFHDVDLIPEDDRNLYSCPTLPRHMSVAVDKFNYTLPYVQLVGGVFSVTVRDFVQLNGYSNLYWGWGGEDDDMAHRIKHKKLKIVRPPASVARYTMIRHAHRPESPNNIRMTFIRMASYRMNRDGLTTAKYAVVSRHTAPLYTKVIVDIGHNHKWHFANPQKLIVSL